MVPPGAVNAAGDVDPDSANKVNVFNDNRTKFAELVVTARHKRRKPGKPRFNESGKRPADLNRNSKE